MKVALTIAGSDSSGGAGIQADIKSFEAFGVFGTSALTVLTAQNTTGVRGISPVDPDFVQSQVEAVLEDFSVDAIKIGMLFNKPIIERVREIIAALDVPVVLDPVFISKAGSPLLEDDAVDAMKTLFEYATVVTPNQHEAKALFGYDPSDTQTLDAIMEQPTAILIKNHKVERDDQVISVDQLVFGHHRRMFQTPYVETLNLHGTGCSFSSAIAANLALGHSLDDAIERAKRFITDALITAPAIGHGPGPINHREGGMRAS